MSYNDFRFETEDGQEIFVSVWTPEKGVELKGVVQLAHGMAEHIARYSQFATFLTDNGYMVYGNDHRGHGKTAGVLENVGFLAEQDGFQLVVNDLIRLTGIIQQKHPGIPVFLLGHSLGSLLVRNYLLQQGEIVQGAILSGTMGNPGLLGKAGQIIAAVQSAVKGKKVKSPLLDKLSFGSYNARFKPNRTTFDWLSRDHEAVDKYIADPYCGTVFSAGFFSDLLSGLYETFKPSNLSKTPKQLPLLLFSGEDDPVGGLKGVSKVYQSYLDAGLTDVTVKFYPGGRHEMLNETNREEVYADILSWLDQHLG